MVDPLGATTLSGVNVKHAEIHVPATGLWHLDVSLQDATDSGTPTREFMFQGLKLQCAVLRSINFAGERGLRLVAGKGGWRKTIPPRQYSSSVQLMMSVVINDAASLVGEPSPILEADASIGTAYIRSQGPAVRVLDMLSTWWSDFDGIVQSKARDVSPIASEFTLMDIDRSSGKYTIATDALADWTPGRTFATPAASGTISRVMHAITGKSVRSFIFTPPLATS